MQMIFKGMRMGEIKGENRWRKGLTSRLGRCKGNSQRGRRVMFWKSRADRRRVTEPSQCSLVIMKSQQAAKITLKSAREGKSNNHLGGLFTMLGR